MTFYKLHIYFLILYNFFLVSFEFITPYFVFIKIIGVVMYIATSNLEVSVVPKNNIKRGNNVMPGIDLKKSIKLKNICFSYDKKNKFHWHD